MSYVRILGSQDWKVGSLSVTTDPTPLSTRYDYCEVFLTNSSDNLVTVYFGTSDAQVIPLAPGVGFTLPVTNIATIFAKTTGSTATLPWLARRA